MTHMEICRNPRGIGLSGGLHIEYNRCFPVNPKGHPWQPGDLRCDNDGGTTDDPYNRWGGLGSKWWASTWILDEAFRKLAVLSYRTIFIPVLPLILSMGSPGLNKDMTRCSGSMRQMEIPVSYGSEIEAHSGVFCMFSRSTQWNDWNTIRLIGILSGHCQNQFVRLWWHQGSCWNLWVSRGCHRGLNEVIVTWCYALLRPGRHAKVMGACSPLTFLGDCKFLVVSHFGIGL
jgi:hypothetical protein